MNILVRLLREQPHLVDGLLSERYLNGIQLYTTALPSLGDDFAALSDQIQTAALRPASLQTFRSSYIPKMKASAWGALLARGTPLEEQSRHLPEWTIFIPGLFRPDTGLLLPDDEDSHNRLSVFTRVGNERRLLSLSITRDWWFTHAMISSGHCSPPDEDGCESGHCGSCELRRIQRGDTEGLTCWCPH